MGRELGSVLRGVDLALRAASSRAGDGGFELAMVALSCLLEPVVDAGEQGWLGLNWSFCGGW